MIQAPVVSPSPAQLQTNLTVAAGWIALGFLAALGVAILYLVFTGKIDLSRLISEPNGDAICHALLLATFYDSRRQPKASACFRRARASAVGPVGSRQTNNSEIRLNF